MASHSEASEERPHVHIVKRDLVSFSLPLWYLKEPRFSDLLANVCFSDRSSVLLPDLHFHKSFTIVQDIIYRKFLIYEIHCDLYIQ